MNILPVGIGRAGVRIVDKFFEYSEATGYTIPSGVAISDAESDFYSLDRVTDNNCVLLDSDNIDRTTELDELLSELTQESLGTTVENSLSDTVDCLLVIGGLSGRLGTHAGIVSEWLGDKYEYPIYGLGILPTNQENKRAAASAATGLPSLRNASDGVIVFDNDAWSKPSKGRIDIEAINDEVVRRIGLIFHAAASTSSKSPSPLTEDQLQRVLRTDGYVSIGYAVEEIQTQSGGLLSRFKEPEESSATDRCEQFASLVRKSALGRLTLPTEIADSDHALLIPIGPSATLSESHTSAVRTGFKDMMSSGSINYNGTVDIGDADFDVSNVAVSTVFGGITSNPRLRQLEANTPDTATQSDVLTNQTSSGDQSPRSLTDRLQSMDNTEWRQSNLQSLSPEEFEQLVANLYRVVGAESQITQASRDGGADVIVNERDGTTLVVQVKKYSPDNPVGKPTIQQTIGVREEHGADIAVIITSSSFSAPAHDLESNSTGVRLLDGESLLDSLNSSPLTPQDTL